MHGVRDQAARRWRPENGASAIAATTPKADKAPDGDRGATRAGRRRTPRGRRRRRAAPRRSRTQDRRAATSTARTPPRDRPAHGLGPAVGREGDVRSGTATTRIVRTGRLKMKVAERMPERAPPGDGPCAVRGGSAAQASAEGAGEEPRDPMAAHRPGSARATHEGAAPTGSQNSPESTRTTAPRRVAPGERDDVQAKNRQAARHRAAFARARLAVAGTSPATRLPSAEDPEEREDGAHAEKSGLERCATAMPSGIRPRTVTRGPARARRRARRCEGEGCDHDAGGVV